ncbi:MAG: hypothetical protein ACI9V8_001509 [Urechidicola sp.]|jgi:hypothetical protein
MRSLTLTGLNQSGKNPPAFVLQEGRIAYFFIIISSNSICRSNY